MVLCRLFGSFLIDWRPGCQPLPGFLIDGFGPCTDRLGSGKLAQERMASITPPLLRRPIEATRTIALLRPCNISISLPVRPGLVKQDGIASWQVQLGDRLATKSKQPKQSKQSKHKKRRNRNATPRPAHIATGRWSKKEHEQFIKGLSEYGKEWKKVATLITTRTIVQIRTHAQKYFQKIQKQAKLRAESGVGTITSIPRVRIAAVVAAVTGVKTSSAAPKSKRPRPIKTTPTTPKRAKKPVQAKSTPPKSDHYQSRVECEEQLFTGLLGENSFFSSPPSLSWLNELPRLNELPLGDWTGEEEMLSSNRAQSDKKKDAPGGLGKLPGQTAQSLIGASPTSHTDMNPRCSLLFMDLLVTGTGLDEKLLLPAVDFSENLKYMEDLHAKDHNNSWLKDMALGDWKDNEDELIAINNRDTRVFVR